MSAASAGAEAAGDPAGPMLIALDIDGTILPQDGVIQDGTIREVDRLRAAGHEVMLATGRSWFDTRGIHERLGLSSRFVVSANGAFTLERRADARADAAGGLSREAYEPRWIETFDPTAVLRRLRDGLGEAHYAVETASGEFRYAGGLFPEASFEAAGRECDFEELLDTEAIRVVVVSPDRSTEEFMSVVERAGLHQVSYSVGWTSWLDIAPQGVNKATALERVRAELGIPRERVFACGDGRNDIEMLAWAAERGRSVAMGQAPQEVFDVASAITGKVEDEGLAAALAQLS